MKVHEYTQGEDLAAIRARLDLDEEALLHIGAAGAIHFDDAAEQDAYDDRVLDEAKGIRRKRMSPEELERKAERARQNLAGVVRTGRPKGSKNKKNRG